MLAYAVPLQQRRKSPTTFSLVVGAHVLAVVLLATAQMDVSSPPKQPNTRVIDVPLPPPPKPEPAPADQKKAEPASPAPDSFIDQRPPLVPLPSSGPVVEPGTPAPPAVIVGPPVVPQPGAGVDLAPSTPAAEPVRVEARLATPADLLRPPYPDSKRRSEEEAVLRLRLTVDARGRVTSVTPVGSADDAFVTAARAHLTRHWRYRPATEDGRAVASTLVVTLRFELEDE